MGSFRQLLRSRSLRLVGGLAVAVAIPVVALVLVQYRSLHDLEHTSAAVLETLSAQVADSLTQALREQFEKPSHEIERVDHAAIAGGDLPLVLARLRERGPAVPIVDAFYVWSAARSGGAVLEMANGPALWTGPMPAFADAGEESPRLIALAREVAAARLPWGTSLEHVAGRSQSVVIHLLFESYARQRLTGFIGFRVDTERVRRDLLAGLLAPLMANVDRRTSLATLVVDVTDQAGHEVFRSHPDEALRVHEERQLPLIFFAPAVMPSPDPCPTCLPVWTLHVGYSEGTAQDIAAASTTGHRTLLAVLVALLALGVVLIARTAYRDMQLAEAKSSFVAHVSHDLKTPLALIQLFAETLALGRVKSAERAREYYAIINAEARKLGALIDNVLDFSRIESGLHMYRLQPLNLGVVVTGVVEGLRAHAHHQGVAVNLEVAAGLPPVLADEDAVGLAVANLIDNAIKYSGSGREVRVEVSPAARGASVRVADEGVGIPRRHHRRIFEKFYRVGVEAAGAPRGCGLGLAIVDQVMRAHRGQVLLESEPGRGSVFTLEFLSATENRRAQADTGDRRRAPDAAGAA